MVKIGFCCKWMAGSSEEEYLEASLNTTTTSISSLMKMNSIAATDKLLSLVSFNVEKMNNMLRHVATLPPERRMFRVSSDILPGFTHEEFSQIYNEPAFREVLESGLSEFGQTARTNGIRITMHPGHFCILNSTDYKIQLKTILELEYHARLFEMMGWGSEYHTDGCAVNIHAGNKNNSLNYFLDGFNKLSQSARNLLTVENDEFCFGLDDLLPLSEHLPIVFDIHHEWIKSGEYVLPDDERLIVVRDSWRGIKPLGHVSTSPEIMAHSQDPYTLPNLNNLRSEGYNLQQIRTHSNNCWNDAVNNLAISHLSWMDIEVEAKHMNLASETLYNRYLASQKK